MHSLEGIKMETLEVELKSLLVKTFAQTVEYGAMCSECCSSQGDGDKVLCEMSDKPLEPDDYCPQQITCIDNVVPKIVTILSKDAQISALRKLLERADNAMTSLDAEGYQSSKLYKDIRNSTTHYAMKK
jgi:hypothetical protein